MKLTKLMAVGLMAGLVLTGCSSNKESKTTVCSGSEPDDEITFVSEGDKVITQKEFSTWSWDDLGLTADDVKNEETMKTVTDSFRSMFDITKGLDITCEVNEKDKTVTFTLLLDYTVADMAELEKAGIVDETDSDYVSLEATIEGFEAEGMTCK